ncbi:MAG: mannitol dehydrogenase family protein [Pseudomonadota bacterium]
MDELTRLSAATLADLPGAVSVPRYDRAALRAGIVHIGLGNFHRAHQAWYLHRLMQEGRAHDWAIVGAGVRAPDAGMRARLRAQDHLTTLIELSPEGISTEVIGSMIDFVPVEQGNGPLIDRMAQPDIRIVSLTVTEGGYYIDPATQGFDAGHADIRHDAESPRTPRTAFGAMIEALRLRRAAGYGPFTCQSCDNLQGNGDILRQTMISLARLVEPDLAEWIDSQSSFPNSMVDSIAPATGPDELALVRSLGIDDAAPVTHETFRQWVIEDDFCAGRPDWDAVGATFSDDVHAYEAMKIRILNAGHQVIANPGELLGIETISGCMDHPAIAALFRKVEMEEIAPTVAPVPGMTPEAYVDLIARRFSNPRIVDTVRRVAFDGSSRHAGFLHPIIRDNLATGAPVEGLALCEALWARMCEGTRDDGSAISPNDPIWNELTAAASAARERPDAWLEQAQIYGDLAAKPRFTEAFERWLKLIWRDGTDMALKQYIQATP